MLFQFLLLIHSFSFAAINTLIVSLGFWDFILTPVVRNVMCCHIYMSTIYRRKVFLILKFRGPILCIRWTRRITRFGDVFNREPEG
jgi:hypothetical protein